MGGRLRLDRQRSREGSNLRLNHWATLVLRTRVFDDRCFDLRSGKFAPACASLAWVQSCARQLVSLKKVSAEMPRKYGPRFLLSIVLIFLCTEPRSIAQLASIPGTDEYPALQSFPLDQPGEHVFHFRQAQKGEMTLLLEVEGPRHGERDRQELTHLRMTVEVTLLNHAGRTVCQAVGSPGDGVSTDKWVLRTSRGEAAFWHRSCAEIKLKRSESYTLTVRLRDVDPKTPKLKATPIFEHSDNYGP